MKAKRMKISEYKELVARKKSFKAAKTARLLEELDRKSAAEASGQGLFRSST